MKHDKDTKPARVLTINDFYDGPRLGVAHYEGVPHIYESESDYKGGIYRLSPIEPELLSLVLEDWAIWLRWESAHKRGEASRESHPALPHERDRHEELKVLIGGRLKCDPQNCIRVKGDFSVPDGKSTWDCMFVRWKIL